MLIFEVSPCGLIRLLQVSQDPVNQHPTGIGGRRETYSIVRSCSSTDRDGSLRLSSSLARISPIIFSTEVHTLSNTRFCCSFCCGVVAATPGMYCPVFVCFRKTPFL